VGRVPLSRHPGRYVDHLRLVCDYLGRKTAPTGGVQLKELEEFLLTATVRNALCMTPALCG